MARQVFTTPDVAGDKAGAPAADGGTALSSGSAGSSPVPGLAADALQSHGAAHTPGPWAFHELGDSLWVGRAREGGGLSDVVLSIDFDPTYTEESRETRLANASLIAAAPDTFDVAQDAHEFAAMFLAFVGRDQGAGRIVKTLDDLSEMVVKLDAKARAALSKARGQ